MQSERRESGRARTGAETWAVSHTLTRGDTLIVASAAFGGADLTSQTLDVSGAVLASTQGSCQGDFDGSGVVDFADFLAFSGA